MSSDIHQASSQYKLPDHWNTSKAYKGQCNDVAAGGKLRIR
jgi:hypothetical protein